MFTKKYLRGDPDLPFNSDPQQVAELMEKFIGPTHEPLWFYRNRGTSSPADEARFHGFTEIENIEVMEQLGMHLPKRTYFFKGFGLERERPYIDKTIEYAKELHARNMLVSVYVGGTMFTDYFFKEVPEAKEWARRDMNNHPVTYGGYQVMRWFACLNNPGYREYTKKVLDIAIKEVDTDEIFFDNQILRYEPRSCRCIHCIKHLRDLVKKNYTLEECEQRYGLAEYPDVQPPYYSQAAKPWRHDKLQLPQIQDWVDHRIMTVIDFFRDMNDHVKAMKPTCVVGMNIKGIHGHNRAYDHGISHGHFADILDFTCIDGYRPGRKPGTDRFWSEVRLFKQGHSTNISVVDGGMDDISIVENSVLNKRKKMDGGWVGVDPWVCSPVGRFLAGNKRLFHERDHCHDIAVLRSEPSTNYNNAKVHEQLMPFEQTLIVEGLPWGIMFDRNIDEIDKYRIIALPEIQCLSDAWLDKLDTFMKNGGGVIASGGAAAYNEWYRPRNPVHAFDRWLGGDLKSRGGSTEKPTGGKYAVADVGKGRFVYVPDWDVVQRWDITDWFAIHAGVLAPVVDRDLFMKAVRDATVGRPLTHRVTGNDYVLVEGIQSDTGVDLHFINHDKNNTDTIMRVIVGLPDGKASATVTITDCEDEANAFPSRTVETVVKGDTIEFGMPTPTVYGLAKVAFE